MSSVNPITKEILLKVVYYGPGLGGKTTTLQHIHKTATPDHRGKMVSLATPVDRTLYFDFLPVQFPKVGKYTLRLHIFTVPGQVYYNATRKLVLTGADGVVFVADSQRSRMDANVESLDNLKENLSDHGFHSKSFPIVMQYNKRDLDDIVPLEELEEKLNPSKAPSIDTVAVTGHNVHASLEIITKEIIRDLKRREIIGTDESSSTSSIEKSIEFHKDEQGISDMVMAYSGASPYKSAADPPTSLKRRRPSNSATITGIQAAADTKISDEPLPLSTLLENEGIPEFDNDEGGDDDDDFDEETSRSFSGEADLPRYEEKTSDSSQERYPSPSSTPPDASERSLGKTPMEAFPHYQSGMAADPWNDDNTDIQRDNTSKSPKSIRTDRPTLPTPAVERSSSEIERVSIDAETGQPTGGLSFGAMWSMADRHKAVAIENAIAEKRDDEATLAIWEEISRQVEIARDGLPNCSAESVISLLGLDGRQYLEVARLTRLARTEKTIPRGALLRAYAFLLQLVIQTQT